MAKGYVQTEVSKRFIEQMEKLIEDGTVKDYAQISKDITFDKTSISNVIRNKRNIPAEKYEEFTRKYNLQTGPTQAPTTKEQIVGLSAAIRVLTLSVVDLKVKATGDSVEKISLELERMMRQETKRLLDEEV